METYMEISKIALKRGRKTLAWFTNWTQAAAESPAPGKMKSLTRVFKDSSTSIRSGLKRWISMDVLREMLAPKRSLLGRSLESSSSEFFRITIFYQWTQYLVPAVDSFFGLFWSEGKQKPSDKRNSGRSWRDGKHLAISTFRMGGNVLRY